MSHLLVLAVDGLLLLPQQLPLLVELGQLLLRLVTQKRGRQGEILLSSLFACISDTNPWTIHTHPIE